MHATGWQRRARGRARRCSGSAGSPATRSTRPDPVPRPARSGDFLDRHYESEKVKRCTSANNVYGKHGGRRTSRAPRSACCSTCSRAATTRCRASTGHVIGGMGAITQAMASARAGARRRDPHRRAGGADRHARAGARPAWRSRTAPRSRAQRRALQRRPEAHLPGPARAKATARGFPRASPAIKMDGPCAKVNFVLSEEPRGHRHARRTPTRTGARSSRWCPRSSSPSAATTSTQRGEIPEELWVDCVLASNVDRRSRPPGKHVMTVLRAVRAVSSCARATWDSRRGAAGRQVVERRSNGTRPAFPAAIEARAGADAARPRAHLRHHRGQHLPRRPDIEQLFFMRPLPGWADYRTPIDGLVSVRRGRASRRRRHRRAGLQRFAQGPARSEEGPVTAGGARGPVPELRPAALHRVHVRR